jgi:hypothetical protein
MYIYIYILFMYPHKGKKGFELEVDRLTVYCLLTVYRLSPSLTDYRLPVDSRRNKNIVLTSVQ